MPAGSSLVEAFEKMTQKKVWLFKGNKVIGRVDFPLTNKKTIKITKTKSTTMTKIRSLTDIFGRHSWFSAYQLKNKDNDNDKEKDKEKDEDKDKNKDKNKDKDSDKD